MIIFIYFKLKVYLLNIYLALFKQTQTGTLLRTKIILNKKESQIFGFGNTWFHKPFIEFYYTEFNFQYIILLESYRRTFRIVSCLKLLNLDVFVRFSAPDCPDLNILLLYQLLCLCKLDLVLFSSIIMTLLLFHQCIIVVLPFLNIGYL